MCNEHMQSKKIQFKVVRELQPLEVGGSQPTKYAKIVLLNILHFAKHFNVISQHDTWLIIGCQGNSKPNDTNLASKNVCDIPFAFYVTLKMAIYSITKCFFNFQTPLRPPKDNQKSLKLLMSILYPHVITSQQLQVSRSFGKVLARFQSWLQQRNIAKMLTFSVTFDPVGKYTPS